MGKLAAVGPTSGVKQLQRCKVPRRRGAAPAASPLAALEGCAACEPSPYPPRCSFMERAVSFGVPAALLSEQYRMHPAICAAVSNEFYAGVWDSLATCMASVDKW